MSNLHHSYVVGIIEVARKDHKKLERSSYVVVHRIVGQEAQGLNPPAAISKLGQFRSHHLIGVFQNRH